MFLVAFMMVMFFSVGASLELFISQKHGVDNSNCLQRNASKPCGSLSYALQILHESAFDEETVFLFTIEDRLYSLEEDVQILQPRMDRYIHITSSNVSTVIRSANGLYTSVITIGLQDAKAITTYNVHVSNIEFEEFSPYVAAVVMVWRSNNISFTNCGFQNNNRSGLNAFDSGVKVEGCSFVNNTSNLQILRELDSQLNPTSVSISGGAGFVFEHAVGLTLVIRNTNFTGNSAAVNNSENFIPPSPLSLLPGLNLIGGGLLIVFRSNASSCGALVEDSSFDHNHATFGGGLFYGSIQTATGNSMEIKRSSFSKNRASQGGGGLSITVSGASSGNEIHVTQCVIRENWSRRGGGLNVFLMSYFGPFSGSLMQFKNTTLDGNSGRASAAVRLDTTLPVGFPINVTPEFIDCIIQNHCANYQTYTSAFTSQRVSAKFTGRNIFSENHGAGALEYQEGRILVNGSLEFVKNSGSFGGAVLLSSSQIILHPGSHMTFLQNYASGVGGAIFVFTRSKYEFVHEYNPECFVTYSEGKTAPSKWRATVSFVKNSAKIKGAAVYISTLSACLWYEKYPFHSVHEAIRWNNTFEYRGNFILPAKEFKALIGPEYDIATDTHHFKAEGNQDMNIELSPGENVSLNIQGYDELNHTIFTIATLSETGISDAEPKLQLDNIMHLLSPVTKQSLPLAYRLANNTVYDEVKNKSVHHFQLEDIFSTLKNRYMFNVTAIPCKLGFKFKGTRCKCDKTIEGVLRCDDDDRTVYLREGHWGGEINGRLVTSFCPPNYCRCEREGDLPGCVFKPNDIDNQCDHNRTGVLCGKCQEGLSVGLRWEECLHCNGAYWIFAIAAIAVVAVCVIIIILNPSLSSELRGPLFFFQVLPFIFKPNNYVGRVVLSVGNVLNLGSPFSYFTHTCLVKGMTNLYAVSMGYLMPLITLFVFVTSYILSANFYLVRFKLRKHSSLQSFWLMTLFVYNYLAVTSFMLLHCPKVGGKMVFFYDGNVKCFRGEHLAMTVVAFVVLFGFVISLPVVVIILTKGYWKVAPQYVNTLITGLRPQCRWWWSVDMFRRLLLLISYSFIPHWFTKQVVTIIMCAFILAVHSMFQPYRKKRVNVVESLYLYILCVIAIMQILQESDYISNIVCSILMIITTIHAGGLTCYKAVGFFERRFKSSCLKPCPRQRNYGSMGETAIDSSIDEAQRRRKDIFDTIFDRSEDDSRDEKGSNYYGN